MPNDPNLATQTDGQSGEIPGTSIRPAVEAPSARKDVKEARGKKGDQRTSVTECCSHHEVEIENWIFAYLAGGVLVAATVIAKLFNLADPALASIPAAIGAVLLSIPLFWAAFQELQRGRPTSSTLVALAIIAALASGEYTTAGFLAFILLFFDQILRRTAWGAQRAIEQLVKLTPNTARILKDGKEEMVSLEQVSPGMVVRVRPGENLPVDGRVKTGATTINQASLTGESAPVEVQAGELVYAGTTNLTGAIDLTVTSVGADTTIGKVSSLIREAESSKTPRQLLIEQVAAYFVPVAITVAGLVLFFTKEVDTAISVLVVVCPSALLLASPTAMVASFAAAARLGIMIKQTNYLEAASNVDTVILDKTGTLTTGVFAVSRLAPVDGVEGAHLLQAAADGEQQSNHPLAKSILTTARQARLTPGEVQEYEEVHGRGVRARTSGGEIFAGRANWIAERFPDAASQVREIEERIEGMSGVHVVRDGKYLGAVGLEDKLRPNARNVIDQLREAGVRRIGIFTGDRSAVAQRVGQAVGVDLIEAECLPEEKYDRLEALLRQGRRVLMVGDGINDGPCLASADVGVAMGLSGSDIATNSAGVALMNDDLSRIPFLVALARRTRSVIAQNIVASIIIAIIGLILAATGSLAIWFAAFYHFLADLFVIGNSFRLVRFGEDFGEGGEEQPETPTMGRRAPGMPSRTEPAGLRTPATAGAGA